MGSATLERLAPEGFRPELDEIGGKLSTLASWEATSPLTPELGILRGVPCAKTAVIEAITESAKAGRGPRRRNCVRRINVMRECPNLLTGAAVLRM